MAQLPIYLDYNATTPLKREVADAMVPFLYEHFGNPSSAHPYGERTHHAIEEARAQLAELLGCAPAEIIFTGGGTEANNMAIKGVAEAYRERGNHLITSAIEHPAVSEPCAYLAEHGYEVTVVPVDEDGRVDPAAVEAAMTDETILVSIMHANNEVGSIQPIRAIAEIVHVGDALLHVDAAQSVGKIPVDVADLGADLLSVAGHKLYAPKGIGALFAREGVRLAKFMHGANHEGNRRAGTENVLEIVGLGTAAASAARDLDDTTAHLRDMRERLLAALRSAFGPDRMRVNGPADPALGLPNTLSVSFRGVQANTLLGLVHEEVAASAGAACHAESVTVSHVLEAMGIPVEWAMGTLRLSTGVFTTRGQVDSAARILIEAVQRLQSA